MDNKPGIIIPQAKANLLFCRYKAAHLPGKVGAGGIIGGLPGFEGLAR
jgi:hypothetical protein